MAPGHAAPGHGDRHGRRGGGLRRSCRRRCAPPVPAEPVAAPSADPVPEAAVGSRAGAGARARRPSRPAAPEPPVPIAPRRPGRGRADRLRSRSRSLRRRPSRRRRPSLPPPRPVLRPVPPPPPAGRAARPAPQPVRPAAASRDVIDMRTARDRPAAALEPLGSRAPGARRGPARSPPLRGVVVPLRPPATVRHARRLAPRGVRRPRPGVVRRAARAGGLMNGRLARRQAALAAVALVGALGAIALSRLGDDSDAAAPPQTVTAGWETAQVGVFELPAEPTACGVTVTAETVGIAHPVLPCGANVLIEHQGRQARAAVVGRGPVDAGHVVRPLARAGPGARRHRPRPPSAGASPSRGRRPARAALECSQCSTPCVATCAHVEPTPTEREPASGPRVGRAPTWHGQVPHARGFIGGVGHYYFHGDERADRKRRARRRPRVDRASRSSAGASSRPAARATAPESCARPSAGSPRSRPPPSPALRWRSTPSTTRSRPAVRARPDPARVAVAMSGGVDSAVALLEARAGGRKAVGRHASPLDRSGRARRRARVLLPGRGRSPRARPATRSESRT